MALTQDQRIEISKKIIDIPKTNAALNSIKANLDTQKVKLENEDNANKSLMDDVTVLINPYQLEIAKLDGNVRTELVEQDMIDAADRTFKNFMFPNDLATPLPSVPDGVWRFFLPFSGSKAIGKDYLEAFPSIDIKEQDKIDAINTQISIIEAATAGIRSTGLECLEDPTGTCAGEDTPPQLTEAACVLDNGVWTPAGGPDVYSAEVVIQQALTDLVTAVNDWKTFLESEKTIIESINTVDTNAARMAENTAAIADIDNAIVVIDAWLLYADWDVTTVLPAGSGGTACALFDAMVAGDFVASKLRSTELQEIKDEITARVAFIPTRISQIAGHLGSVGQDLVTGEFDMSGSGFYDKRFKTMNIRLNILGGSLNKKKSIDKSKGAQDAMKATNDNAASVYTDVMKVTALKAPASNIGTIHVQDGTGFAIADAVYVVAEKQEELSGTISNIDGNTIFLSFNVPEKYTQNNSARLYKIL